jgi:hypothetical protein
MSMRLVLFVVALLLAAGCDKEIKEARLDRPAGQGEAGRQPRSLFLTSIKNWKLVLCPHVSSDLV